MNFPTVPSRPRHPGEVFAAGLQGTLPGSGEGWGRQGGWGSPGERALVHLGDATVGTTHVAPFLLAGPLFPRLASAPLLEDTGGVDGYSEGVGESRERGEERRWRDRGVGKEKKMRRERL